MTRSYLLATGLGVVALAIGSSAPAQQAKPGVDFRAVFTRLDANGDTVLERDEVPDAGRAAFDRLLKRGDANGDGKLGADEMRDLGQKVRALANGNGNGNGKGAAGRLRAMDKDGDGEVTKAEFTGPDRLFDRLDADGDGKVTKAEVAGLAAMAPAAKKAEAKAEKKAAKPPLVAAPPRFRMLDKDGDGKVSKAEFPREKLFDRLDVNGDGFLSPEEIRDIPRPNAAKKP